MSLIERFRSIPFWLRGLTMLLAAIVYVLAGGPNPFQNQELIQEAEKSQNDASDLAKGVASLQARTAALTETVGQLSAEIKRAKPYTRYKPIASDTLLRDIGASARQTKSKLIKYRLDALSKNTLVATIETVSNFKGAQGFLRKLDAMGYYINIEAFEIKALSNQNKDTVRCQWTITFYSPSIEMTQPESGLAH